MLRILLIFFVILIALVLGRFWMLPYPVQEILLSKYFSGPMYSYTVYSGTPVDITLIHKVKTYKGFFALDRSLEPDETIAFVNILLDTTNYDANQPAQNLGIRELVFTYLDEKGSLLGASHLNPPGEFVAVPHQLIRRTGYLTSDGLKKLRSTIELQ